MKTIELHKKTLNENIRILDDLRCETAAELAVFTREDLRRMAETLLAVVDSLNESVRVHLTPNARLIAAAPDMLAALMDALAEMDFHDSGGVQLFGPVREKARTAIAKATE